MAAKDFLLPAGTYLASHGIGRPLQRSQSHFNERYFDVWAQSSDPWQQWLGHIQQFRHVLAQVLGTNAEALSPQVNVAGGIAKLARTLPALKEGQKVLIAEHDFPSTGFALTRTLPLGQQQLRFIPKSLDLTDIGVWADYLTADIGMVWLSHGFANLGLQAPVQAIIELAHQRHIMVTLDVAQTAGVIPIELDRWQPDFALGSCVKWLCGGAGAGFLWVNRHRLVHCHSQDLGWFGQQDPFELDVHHYVDHPDAQRFWGGTPTVAPFVIAADSMQYLVDYGIARIRQHNLALQQQLIDAFGELVVSPHDPAQRSGTVLLNLGQYQSRLLTALQAAGIHTDERFTGVRISPHLYNHSRDMGQVIQVLRSV